MELVNEFGLLFSIFFHYQYDFGFQSDLLTRYVASWVNFAFIIILVAVNVFYFLKVTLVDYIIVNCKKHWLRKKAREEAENRNKFEA